jgi:energy-coupling factor transport system permease protein
MFQNAPILLGQYRPLDSYLHRLDARSKILPVVLVLLLALVTDSILFYFAIMLALIGALLGSGIRAANLARNFRPILLLVLITSLYHLVFTGRESAVVVDLFGWRITEAGVQMAAFYSMRLVLFVSIAFLITLTNSPSELAEAFSLLLKPLTKLRAPVHELSMILFIAIRFIPILYEEFTAVKHAQMVRGVDFGGSVMKRAKKTTFIIIPVFVAAIQRADEIARAMEARGYRSGRARTSYTRSRFGLREWSFSLGACLLVVVVFVVTK